MTFLRRMSVSTWLTIFSFFGIVLSIVWFCVTLVIKDGLVTPTDVALSLSIIIILWRLDDFVSSFIDDMRHAQERERLDELVIERQNSVDLEHVGRSNAAMKAVSTTLDTAVRIKNTYVNTTSNFEDWNYNPDVGNSLSESLSVPRRVKIKFMDIVGGKIDEYVTRSAYLQNLENIDLRARLLEDVFPIINFVIVEHSEASRKNKEVYFGWGHHEGASDDEVFKSSNPKLVRIFENYFKVLESRSSDISFDDLAERSKI